MSIWSTEANINITATDNASTVIDQVSTNLENMKSTAQDTGTSSSQALGGIVQTGTQVEGSSMRLMRGVSHLGVSAVIAYTRWEIAQEAVENAQVRQELAQMRLSNAIQRYGAGSREAIIAQKELEISTRAVGIAQDRLWVRTLFGIGFVIPNMIVGITQTISALRGLQVAQLATVATTHALTTAKLALLAVTTFGIGAAIGLAAATLATSQFQAQTQTQNVNVYGNVNLQSPSYTPAAFGQAATDWSRTTRP